jgi:hypothetical protein
VHHTGTISFLSKLWLEIALVRKIIVLCNDRKSARALGPVTAVAVFLLAGA